MTEKNEELRRAIEEISKILKPLNESISRIKIPTFDEILPNFQEITRKLSKIQEVLFNNIDLEQLKIIESSSKINGADVSYLKDMYWVIPFEYDYGKFEKIRKSITQIQFEKYMEKYHGKTRIKREFSSIRNCYNEKDKKVLLKQIEEAYENENYAVCITSLITLLDGTTLVLLDPESLKKHNSHKVIGALKEYMNEPNEMGWGYELFFKICILNNFYEKLYSNRDLVNGKTNILSRPLNSHGSVYSNTKIDVLRLLDVISFCQQLIKELEMQNQFTYVNNKGFTLK